MTSAMVQMQANMQTHQAMANIEDNVENLVARLEGQGKKVKILSEEEEAEEAAAKLKREEAMAQKVKELQALE